MNMSKVKDTKYEEPSVSYILLIKTLGHFKLFQCGKEFFNNLETACEHACTKNSKDNDWAEIYDTTKNYNDRNHTPLSNSKIRETTDKVILEEQAETSNVTVDTFILQRNEGDSLINKVKNLTINNKSGNDLINKVTNIKIKDVGNNLNGLNASDIQVQFSGDPAGIYHQNLLSIREIGIRHKEVHVLNPHTEPSID